MARYRHLDTNPGFLAVDLARQLLPGTFEHALNHLLDHELDLSGFDARFRNDTSGASAYPPAMLLKIVLFACAQGIVSPRRIERARRKHVTLSATGRDSSAARCSPSIRLPDMNVTALIADNGMRQRDERFAGQDRYKQQPDPLYDKSARRGAKKQAAVFRPEDFRYDSATQTCTCPAGKSLYRNGSNCVLNSYAAVKFRGSLRNCLPCEQRGRCLRTPDKTQTRQVAFFQGKAAATPVSYTDRHTTKRISPQPRRRPYAPPRRRVLGPPLHCHVSRSHPWLRVAVRRDQRPRIRPIGRCGTVTPHFRRRGIPPSAGAVS